MPAHLFPEEAQAWPALTEDADETRLWGEVHWQVDNEVGMAIGCEVGERAVSRSEEMGVDW